MKTKVKKKRAPREKNLAWGFYAKTLKAWGFEQKPGLGTTIYEKKINTDGGELGIRINSTDLASLPKKVDIGQMALRMIATSFTAGIDKAAAEMKYELSKAQAARDTYKGKLAAIGSIVDDGD